LFFQTTERLARGPINKEGKRWQTGKKIKVNKAKAVAVAASPAAVARVAAVRAAADRAVAVKVVADNPVDSEAVVAAVATANASRSYLQR
jgi:hypothetical protein